MAFVQTLLATPYGALGAMVGVMALGEYLTKLVKGKLPSALFIMFILLTCFWTGLFPADIATKAGASGTIFSLSATLLIVDLGSKINRKEMIAQWKTVVICLVGLAFIIGVVLTVGAKIVGFEDAVAAAGPITGAAMATAMLREAAEAVGNTHAALVAIVCNSCQALFGYPLVAMCLKKEVLRLHGLYTKGELLAPVVDATAAAKAAKPDSTNWAITKLCIAGVLAYLIQTVTNGNVSVYVAALIVGFVLTEVGFLKKNSLTAANCYGLCITFLMVYLFGGLSSSSLETIIPVFGTAIILLAISTCALALAAFVSSKVFKMSFFMCWAIAMNAYLGFPINVMLTNEALDNNLTDPQEKEVISAEIMPKMLIASFVCVTIVSVIIAGFLVKLIH